MINYSPETSLGQIGFRYGDSKLPHPPEENVGCWFQNNDRMQTSICPEIFIICDEFRKVCTHLHTDAVI